MLSNASVDNINSVVSQSPFLVQSHIGNVVCGFGIITAPRKKEVKWDCRKTVRDNLALLYKGQELVDLVFKGNKKIPNSTVRFDENGMFHFYINDVAISESNSLKELCVYLEHIMG